MIQLKSQRSPILPSTPSKEDQSSSEAMQSFYRNLLQVLIDLRASTYDDLQTLKKAIEDLP